MLKEDEKINKKIAALYRETAKEIEKDTLIMLENYASRTGLSLADVKKKASLTDIDDYKKKAERYVKEKKFSKKANKEMGIYNLKMKMSRNELILRHIDLELIAMTDETEELIYERLVTGGMNEVKRQAGILGTSVGVTRKDVEYIAKRKFHDSDFSSRLWKNKQLLHKELDKRLTDQITRGLNPREAARKLRQDVEQTVFNSERIMITESARVQSEIQIESYDRVGIEEYEFIATEGACDICDPLDGKVFKRKDAMPGKNIMPMHPFCRCSSAAHFDNETWEKSLQERGL